MSAPRAHGRPDVAFLTDEPGSNGFARKARALAPAFESLGARFDAVYIKGLEGTRVRGGAREIGLGDVRAAASTPALTRYLRRERPRLAFVNSGQMGPAAVLAGRLAGCRVVPWEPTFLDRDLPSLPRRMRLMALAQRALYRIAPAIAAPSADMVAWAIGRRRVDPDAVHLLPNPIDADAVRSAAGPAGPDPEGPLRLCAVGRLVEQKGYDVLIEALGSIRDRLPEGWRLTIVGGVGVWRGGWDERIRSLARARGIAANVELAGHLSNPHVVMKRSHLFVHTARWEPFGNVIVEALALELPVIAADCPGGPREILDGGRYGRLVAPASPEGAATEIERLAHDPEARSALAAAAPAGAERYAPRRIAERMLEIADRLEAGGRTPPTATTTRTAGR